MDAKVANSAVGPVCFNRLCPAWRAGAKRHVLAIGHT